MPKTHWTTNFMTVLGIFIIAIGASLVGKNNMGAIVIGGFGAAIYLASMNN